MREKTSEGFDPLKIQAENKLKRERREKGRRRLRKAVSLLLLPILIVGGMYAVGGTWQFSEWNSLPSLPDARCSCIHR